MSCRKCDRRCRGRLCRDCEIEARAEERARANARDQDADDDEDGEPVPLPDGGATHPKTTPSLADELLAHDPETAIEIEYDPTQGSTQTVRGIVDETGRNGGVKLVPKDTAYLLAREVGGDRLFRIWGYAGGRVESAQSRAEIEHEHDEGQTTPRRLGDLVDIRDIFPDGGYPTPTTDAEIDRWIDLIESHADDTTVADYLGGIHEQTLRAEFGVERQPSTIRKYLKDDARVTAVLGFGEEGVRRSWAPADSDIGIGEDVTCPKGGSSSDTGQPCVVCGYDYDRDAHAECPQCTNGSVEDYDAVTDGGRAIHPADTALTHRGVGDQQYCPHGDAACARGEVPCWGCLTGGKMPKATRAPDADELPEPTPADARRAVVDAARKHGTTCVRGAFEARRTWMDADDMVFQEREVSIVALSLRVGYGGETVGIYPAHPIHDVREDWSLPTPAWFDQGDDALPADDYDVDNIFLAPAALPGGADDGCE